MISPKLKNILDAMFSNDGTTFEDHLNCIFSQRSNLWNKKIEMVIGKSYQPRLTADKIFTLKKYGTDYFIREVAHGRLNRAEGFYFFIIPINSPYEILCGELISGTEGRRQNIEGHTSLTGESQVYFAGMMKFTQGKLIFWNNGSGHFMPKPEQRYYFLPHIQLLLPEYLFCPHILHTTF